VTHYAKVVTKYRRMMHYAKAEVNYALRKGRGERCATQR